MCNKKLPPTTKRVALNTCHRVNQEIRDKTVQGINQYVNQENEILSQKIKDLDEEWDTERVLETNAGSMILTSSILGYHEKKSRWFFLTGTIGVCLLHHALHGWCPPLPVIRRLGVRTAEEISHEKMVFKKLRGDFSQHTKDGEELLHMAEK